jgi:ABC-type sugar transport system substrate-binding protein
MTHDEGIDFELLEDTLELDRADVIKLAGILGLTALGLGRVGDALGAVRSAQAPAKTFGWAIAANVPFFEEQMTRHMKKALGPTGYKLVTQSEDGSAVKAQQIMSAFITNNYAFMARADAAPPKPFEPLATQAAQKGLFWINHAVQAVGPAGQNVVFDHAAAGKGIGAAAVRWAKRNGIDKPVVGMLANIPDPEGKKRTDYAFKTLKAAIPASQLAGQVYSVDQPQTGATATANLLQAHPDINVIFTFNTVSGKGSVQAATEAGKTNRNEFFIGMADAEAETLDLVKAENSICQANWGAYFEFSAVLMVRDSIKFSKKQKVLPTRRVGGKAFTNAREVTQYQKVTANPLAPVAVPVYKDKSIVAYSPIKLKTGQSVNSIFKA